MLKFRAGVATVAVGVLAVGLTGCGSHQTADTQADRGARAADATHSSKHVSGGASLQGSHGSRHATKQPKEHAATHAHATKEPSSSTSSSTSGTPPKGSYDDTSGTKAHPPKNQIAVLQHLPGVHASRCVTVGNRTDVRSGSIAMGNFALARQNFRTASSAYNADPSFFYVIPRSRAAKAVTVVASRLGGRHAPVRIRSRQVEQAAQWNYFPIQIQLPNTGTWRFRVTTGAEHGCFDASFTT
jgi:hypothetical protein